MKKVAIIGAGACGLLLANLLSDEYEVTLLEKNNKLAKKVLASGNGKCNFTNIGDYSNKYNNDYAYKIVDKFDNKYLRDYLSSLGLLYRVDNENRAYPLSESSTTVVDILKKGLKKIRILLDSKVTRLENLNNGVNVYYNKEIEKFDYVVCCSGSNASNLGSDYAYSYLKDFCLKINDTRASLTPIIVNEDVKELSGVRVKCGVNLYKNDELFYSEDGEVLFKDNGLSGIVIYNISSMINRDISANYKIHLDLLKDSYNKIETDSLIGIVHPKITNYMNNYNLFINDLIFTYKALDDLKNAQVTSGGVDVSELNDDLSLKSNNNIYLGGEVIDCDGMCGGYNLQFAFSCAFVINESIRNKKTIR